MESSAIFDLYLQLAPGELFRLLQRQMGVKVRNGIYSARLVIWMMINQRLQARGTLAGRGYTPGRPGPRTGRTRAAC